MSTPARSQRRGGGTGCLLPILAALGAAALVIIVAVIVRGGGDEADTDPVTAVLEDRDAVIVQIVGEAGDLALTYSPSRGNAVVSGTDIDLPDGNDVYGLWRAADSDAPALVHTFRPDSFGTVTELIEDVDGPGDATYTVTVEPPSAGDTPTGSIVASS